MSEAIIIKDEKQRKLKKVKEIGTKAKPIKTSFIRHFPIIWGLIVLGIAVAGVLMMVGVVDLASILAGISAIPADLQATLASVLPIALIAVGAIVFLVFVTVAISKSRKKYFLSECMLLQQVGDYKETCKLIIKPGMDVSIKRHTFKSFFFNYGDVIIKLGPGEVGEITLRDVKKPKRVKVNLDVAIKNNCVSFSRTMVFSV